MTEDHTLEELKSMGANQLRTIAKRMNISRFKESNLARNKQDLIEAICTDDKSQMLVSRAAEFKRVSDVHGTMQYTREQLEALRYRVITRIAMSRKLSLHFATNTHKAELINRILASYK